MPLAQFHKFKPFKSCRYLGSTVRYEKKKKHVLDDKDEQSCCKIVSLRQENHYFFAVKIIENGLQEKRHLFCILFALMSQ
jgi:hypothetical protein